MKNLYKLIFFLVIVLFNRFDVSGQVSKKGLPRTMRQEYQSSSSRKESVSIPVFTIPQFTKESILERLSKVESKSDCKDCRSGDVNSNAYGIGASLNVNVLASAMVETTNEGKIYRYNIDARGAKGLQVYFEEFVIPKGGEVYVYNNDKSMTLGAFTEANNTDGKDFLLQIIRGSFITIEYFEPKNSNSNLTKLKIKDVVYCFADVFGVERGDGTYGASTSYDVSCIPDLACSSDRVGWGDIGSSVGIILGYSITGRLAYVGGTGTLMNNTKQDATPYFLTAFHVFNTIPINVTEWGTIVIQFDYQKAYCGQDPNDVNPIQSVSGASLVTGNATTDHALLRLFEQPPMEYNLTFAGWENFDTYAMITGPYTGIHHPGHSLKKISTTSLLQESYYANTTPGTGKDSWYVKWESGVTQSWSSGSPLFNSRKQLIGFLYGGTSNCTVAKDNYGNDIGPDKPDWYNKLSGACWNYLNTYLSPNSVTHNLDSYIPIYPPQCFDRHQQGNEDGVDCGGPCAPCKSSCNDKIQNGAETGIDCGGPCTPCPSCFDNIRNQGELKIDCGGPCSPCPPAPTCFDHTQNQGETGIDCGGPCAALCSSFCSDGIRNGDEVLTDCGGSCTPCPNKLTGTGSTLEITTACFNFGNYSAHKKFTDAFTVENVVNCNTGWKAAYGHINLYQDAPNNTVLEMEQESNFLQCDRDGTGTYETHKVTRGSGVYYQLPANLDPKKEYVLHFKMRQPSYNLGVNWSPTNYVEISATRGLAPSHTPNQSSTVATYEFRPPNPYQQIPLCVDYPSKYREYNYPAYTFEKQTLVATGSGGRDASWQRYEIVFTVESSNLNQLFIATHMEDISKVNGAAEPYYHFGLLYFDDIVIVEKQRYHASPYIHSSIIAPGGGGFYTGGQFPFLPGPACKNGSVTFGSSYLKSINVTDDITVSQTTLQKNSYCPEPRQASPAALYYCDVVALNAGKHVDFTGNVDIAVGVNLSAEIASCSMFHGSAYRTSLSNEELTVVAEKTFSIYPNPSEGIFNVVNPTNDGSTYRIYVYNSMGELVHEQESNAAESTVSLSHVAKGMYTIRINRNNEATVKTQRVIIL